MIRLAIFLIAFVTCAHAQQGLPALFDVQGVANDDTLNVRTTPNASSRIIGTLAPNHTDIEVVAQNAPGTWGQINLGEQAGWVNMRFLKRTPGTWQDLTTPLSCFGAEPFWLADLTPRVPTAFDLLGEVPLQMQPVYEERRLGPLAQVVMRHKTQNGDALSFVTASMCSDGMSDRMFGLSASVVLTDGDQTRTFFGCCTLALP